MFRVEAIAASNLLSSITLKLVNNLLSMPDSGSRLFQICYHRFPTEDHIEEFVPSLYGQRHLPLEVSEERNRRKSILHELTKKDAEISD
jgi:hypothetical protein